MNSFLCRVMTLVFLLNCLTPATGWGQTSRRSTAGKSTLEKKVTAKVKQAQQDNTPASQFYRADQEARAAHNARFAQADSIAKANSPDPREAWQEMVAWERTQHLIQQPSSLYVAPRIPSERAPVENQSRAKNFLKKVTNNEITFEQLIDYADPVDPNPSANDLLTIAYAAEVISNTVGEAMQLDSAQYDLNEFQAQLVQIQARLLYRLALLGFAMPSYTANPAKDPASLAHAALEEALNAPSTRKTMAVAGLRMALLKIHQFYQAKNLPDPADEYQKEMVVWKSVKMETALIRNSRENDGLGVLNRLGEMAHQPELVARKQAAQTVKKHGNLAVFMDQFIREFKESIDNEPEQGSAAYQHAQVCAEYATAYALEYDPAYLKKIVEAVDQGPKETDFKQDYSPILNAIFVTVFENTRYSAMGEAKTKQVLNLLQKFSDPQQYSLPTRVFALEAASLLYRPFNQDSFNVKKEQPLFAFFAPVNFNQPDENLRRVFAARVAELYCPLVSTNSHVMKDYGLGSDEMEALADKLGYMYDGFYDIHTAFFEDNTKPVGQYARDNYPQTACNITTHGNLNTLKKSNERTAAFLYFSAEVLFWVYGGEVFAFLGTAFRLTRGAVAALPKAGKAFTVAARGEKVAAFNAQIQEGAKFANWVYKNKRQQGYMVEALVQTAPAQVKKEVVVENGVARTVEREIQAVTEYKPVTSTHALQGKRSLWNPKRWLGMGRGEDVIGYRVTRMEPGLQTTVAEMRFAQPVDGLHNLQEVSQMTRQLKTADGSRFYFEQQPYWRGMMNMNQVMQEQWTLAGLKSSFKNQMDLWIPLGETAQKTGKISETTRWWNVTQWGAPSQWGELVGSEMWGKAGIGGTSARMPIYVAPKTPFQFTWRGAANQLTTRQEGLANISEVLPGFYTSGADVATGNVYSQMFNAYMKPLNWQSTLAKTFLPDYVPTKVFWQSMRANPVLGAQLAPQLLWRNRFGITTALFAAYAGADRLIYPPFKAWMEDQATKDANEEIAKYGDTFSPDQAKMDELLLQEMGVDLSDKRAMSAYNDVLAAQPDQVDGTLFSAPIIGARRAMGMSFIGDDVKADYEHQAVRTDLNRALLHRNYTRFKEGQQATEKWQKETREFTAKDEQSVLSFYPQGFAAKPQLKQALHQVYQTYEKELFAAQTQQEQEQAIANFIQQRDALVAEVAELDMILQQAKQVTQSPQELADMEIQMTKLIYTDLVTPAVEQQIYRIYRTYAQACEAALKTADPVAVLTKATRQKTAQLQALMDELVAEYLQKGYGPAFDSNAADEQGEEPATAPATTR